LVDLVGQFSNLSEELQRLFITFPRGGSPFEQCADDVTLFEGVDARG